jgi:hypothetical protein
MVRSLQSPSADRFLPTHSQATTGTGLPATPVNALQNVHPTVEASVASVASVPGFDSSNTNLCA